MKTTKQTKNDLLKIIRDSKQTQFEVIEPVVAENLSKAVPLLKNIANAGGAISLVIIKVK